MKRSSVPTAAPPGAEYLTDESAAALAAVAPKTIRDWRMERGLPFVRLSPRMIRIPRKEFVAWLDGFSQRITRVEN